MPQGEKAKKLVDAAEALRNRATEQVTRVAVLPECVPAEAADYLAQVDTLPV